MLRYFRVKLQPEKLVPDAGSLTKEQLSGDPGIPITLHQLNELPENAKRRVYRALLPPALLAQYGVDPISWKGKEGKPAVRLIAEAGTSAISLGVTAEPGSQDDFITIELSDNTLNGIDLNLLLLSDPHCPRFNTDRNEDGSSTLFGKGRRNLVEEERAMQAGLAPGQVRDSLGASKQILAQLETFLSAMGHRAYFLEPLTYASAWVFERRGFAYVRGHKLMDDIHQKFQPGGALYQALDGSTVFRRPELSTTIRGRSWAIHDGILDVIDEKWDKLRMVKQIGRHAGVDTFPGAIY